MKWNYKELRMVNHCFLTELMTHMNICLAVNIVSVSSTWVSEFVLVFNVIAVDVFLDVDVVFDLLQHFLSWSFRLIVIDVEW